MHQIYWNMPECKEQTVQRVKNCGLVSPVSLLHTPLVSHYTYISPVQPWNTKGTLPEHYLAQITISYPAQITISYPSFKF